jgi:type I restriction enzyme S subunit
MAMNQSCYAITADNHFFIHQLTLDTVLKLKKEAIGAVFPALVTKDFDSQMLIEPMKSLVEQYDNTVETFYNVILNKTFQNEKLLITKNLLLSKLATIEN